MYNARWAVLSIRSQRQLGAASAIVDRLLLLAVFFRVCPRCLFSVVAGVRCVPMCRVSVVGSLLMTA